MPSFTVKQARNHAGLRQIDMAEGMNIGVDTYRKIEKNPETATIKQAKKIAELTGLSLDFIFFGS